MDLVYQDQKVILALVVAKDQLALWDHLGFQDPQDCQEFQNQEHRGFLANLGTEGSLGKRVLLGLLVFLGQGGTKALV